MGLFNVVGRSTMAAGQPEDVTQILANLDAIAAILNGNIEDVNVKAAANIAVTKLLAGSNLQSLMTQGGGIGWAQQGADLAIVANAITALYPFHRVTGGGTLKTLNGGVNGAVVTLKAHGAAFSIDSTANIFATPAGGVLTVAQNQSVTLLYDSVATVWVVSNGGSPSVTYRKNTTKTVANTVAATDLLNGEITIGASAMGANSIARCKFWGTHKQATAGVQGSPRFQVVLGGTTLLDTNVLPASETANINVWGWDLTLDIANLGATNSQMERMILHLDQQFAAAVAALFIGGQGLYNNGASYGGYAHAVAKGYQTSAIDMTVARLLELRVVNAVADPAYDTILKGALIEII